MDNLLSVTITPSVIIEYLYCPRFIYFMFVQNIPQNEGQRFKVQQGREVHEYKALTNEDYLRKDLKVIKKLENQDLYSRKYPLNGIVDEILFFENGKASPLDYKYAEYDGEVFTTYKMQSVIYGLLIEEIFNIEVEKGFLVFTRSKNKLIEVPFGEKDIKHAIILVEEVMEIIDKNIFPKATKYKTRCDDCCYNNICEK